MQLLDLQVWNCQWGSLKIVPRVDVAVLSPKTSLEPFFLIGGHQAFLFRAFNWFVETHTNGNLSSELNAVVVAIQSLSLCKFRDCSISGLPVFHCLPVQFSSVAQCVRLFVTPWIAACQASLSITNFRSSLKLNPSSRWCHPAISCSVIPVSSCPQSLPASESFPMSQLFTWGGQSTGVSALPSFLPKNNQDWSLEWTGWISLQSKGLSRVFSNTTVQKHQFFGAQLSSQSKSHIHRWLLEKP